MSEDDGEEQANNNKEQAGCGQCAIHYDQRDRMVVGLLQGSPIMRGGACPGDR